MAVVSDTFWVGKSVLITGITGFKGSWLATWLVNLGAKVSGFGLAPASDCLFLDAEVDKTCDVKIIDIRNYKDVEAFISVTQPDIVFHLAAQPLVRSGYDDPVNTFSTNIMGTVNLLDAIRRTSCVRVVINVTTDKVYKNSGRSKAFRENDKLGGVDPYSNSKSCSELITESYYNSFFKGRGVGIATARAGNVLGGGDVSCDRLVPDFYRSVKSKKCLIIRNPKSIRPWQHVLEPLNGYMLLAEALWRDPTDFSKAWNFGPSSQHFLQVIDLVRLLSTVAKRAPNIVVGKPDFTEDQFLTIESKQSKKKLDWQNVLEIRQVLELVNDFEVKSLRANSSGELIKQQIQYYMSSLIKAKLSVKS